jgi:hypothetical protein
MNYTPGQDEICFIFITGRPMKFRFGQVNSVKCGLRQGGAQSNAWGGKCALTVQKGGSEGGQNLMPVS